jgi:hypothetical protein
MALFEEDPTIVDDGMALVLDIVGVDMVVDDDARDSVSPW